MGDPFTSEQRAAVMRRVKGRDTTPELKVRRTLWRLGFRYRLQRRDLPGKPDLAMAGRRLAVFVHGCFWHGHDCRRGARAPKANAQYWSDKIARNRARDDATRRRLIAEGWRGLVIWECALRRADLDQALDRAVRDDQAAWTELSSETSSAGGDSTA
ncbi:very short patch repair endonuclease [Brevundimonas sp. 2R-24]|uniref:Very short patch repair endonuclease n=1 Tax=Peiella sedimenti TaxID=3061083 RepID=A0ABT8SK84_9CAUL|nr:very short patch repair endonuclease [Caulobacteraceae bacterium XZ-24]